MSWLRLAARGVVGAVFLLLSLDKIRYPRIFGEAILGYDIFPELWIPTLGLTLPWLEFWAGLGLLLGLHYRACALVLTGLCASFTLLVSSALWRGLDISCGCFRSATWSTLGWRHLALDLILLALALMIYWRGPGPLALDDWLQKRRTARSENGQTGAPSPDRLGS